MKTTRHLGRLPLCLAIGAAILLCGCSRADKKDRHLARGQAFFKAQQYDKAEIEFLNALRIDRTNAVALRQLGLGYHHQGRLLRAYAFLQKASELEPGNDEVRLRLGSMLVASRKLKEAREQVEAVLAHDPANNEAFIILGDCVTSIQEIDELRQRVNSFRSHAENTPGFHLALGALDLRQQRTNDALAHFERALALDPQSSPAHVAMGNISTLLKDNSKAEYHFKKASELAPLRSSRKLQYATFKLRNGDVAAAKESLESIAKQAPDFLPTFTLLAEIALADRRFDEAASLCKTILVRDPGNYDAMLLLGRVNIAKGEPAKALPDFERIVSAYPRVPYAHYHLAVAHLLNKNQPRAIGSLYQALALDPKHTESILLLAELNIRKGDIIQATSALKQLLKDQPHVVQAHLLLANAYRAQRELDAAIGVYENMSKLFPRNPHAPYLWGQILLLQKKPDEARQKFEAAVQVAPDFVLALGELVDLDISVRQFSVAHARIDHCIQSFPKSPAALLLRAKIYSAQDDHVRAEEALSRSIALDPNYQPAYLALARVYVVSKKHQQAIDKLSSALAISSNNVPALVQLGMIHTELKNYAAARDAYEKVLAIDPRSVLALNNLAYVCSEHLNLLDKALVYARAARDLRPADPFPADTLGWILFKRGEYPWALSLLQESANSEKIRSGEVLFHLAMTHYMLGEEQPARIAFERALQIGDDFPGKAEAQQKLAFLSNSANDSKNIADLERQLSSSPGDPIILGRLAILYEKSGAADKAANAYQLVLQHNPRNVSAILKLAHLYTGPLQNKSKAMQLARDARALAPEDPQVGHTLGRLAFEAGDHQWALSLLQESARKLTERPDVLYDLAWAWYSLGRLAEADSSMRRALAINTPFENAPNAKRFIELNAVYLHPSRVQAAGPQIAAALKEDPAYVPALVASALSGEQSGNTTVARDLYLTILKRFPGFAPAHKRLANLLSSSDLTSAYDHALKARAALPDDSEVARTLGILTFRRQDYTRAVQLLTEGSRERPNDAEALYYLGMAYFHLKQKDQSRQALQQAVATDGSGHFVAEARRTLAQLQ